MKKVREKLNAKLRKSGGFTLVEMLIVVAIIAILIAIAIPMVSASLERAREATDAANERAALGMAYTEVMANNKLGGQDITTSAVTAYYKVSDSRGDLVKVADCEADNFKYGKGTVAGDDDADNAGKGITIVYTPASKSGGTTTEEKFEVKWTNKS